MAEGMASDPKPQPFEPIAHCRLRPGGRTVFVCSCGGQLFRNFEVSMYACEDCGAHYTAKEVV